MSEQGLEVLDSSLQKTHEWLNHLAQLGHLEKGDAYKVLRAVLHTLRDRLPPEHAVHLAAQLPTFLRGVFYEGWDLDATPIKMHRAEFLDTVRTRLVSGRFLDPERATREVLFTTAHFVSGGEMEKLRHCFPADLQDLWPELLQAH